MKKYRLYLIAADEEIARRYKGMKPYQGWEGWKPTPADGPVKSGPANHRLVVVDKDPDSGMETAPISLKPPTKAGWHVFDFNPKKETDFIPLLKVSVFATALWVMDLFEEREAIGRRLDWAFGDAPLKLVTRAGPGKNAAYNRHLQSVQFFYFTSTETTNERIYTSASPDIVAHEIAHAVLDAVAPYLYDSSTPQTRSLHEAISDLTAAFFTFELANLRKRILEKTQADLTQANEFGWIGEKFGTELHADGGSPYLRTLYNKDSLDPRSDHYIKTHEPHDLSTIFSGAVYAALIQTYEDYRVKLAREKNTTPYKASGQALWFTAQIMRRILYRAFDYLPYGDINFLDVARALIATDLAAYPNDAEAATREALMEKFINRGIGTSRADFLPANISQPNPFKTLNLAKLEADAEALKAAVNAHRDFLQIPPRVPIFYCSCQSAKKLYIRKGGRKEVLPEWIIKASWPEFVITKDLLGLPKKVRILRGTSLVLDGRDKRAKIRLSTNPALEANQNKVEDHAAKGRQSYLRGMVRHNRIAFEHEMSVDEAFEARKIIAVTDKDNDAFHLIGAGEFMHLWAHEDIPETHVES